MNGKSRNTLGLLVLAALLDAAKNKQGSLFDAVPDCGDPACPVHGMFADVAPGFADIPSGILNEATRAPQYRDKPLPAVKLIEGKDGMSQAIVQRTSYEGKPAISLTMVSCVEVGPDSMGLMLGYEDAETRDKDFVAFDVRKVGEAMDAALINSLSSGVVISL